MKKIYGICLISFLLLICLTGCGAKMKAGIALSSKNYPEAIQLYNAYLAENPDDIHARSRLGFAYFKAGKFDQAIKELTRVLQQKPEEPYAILYLGLAYVNKEEFGKAIKVWEGYKNKKAPLVEAEIKKQLTLLRIVESQRLAKKALKEEKKLQALQPDKNTIAITYFKNLSNSRELAAFQKGLVAMIISDLSKISSLKPVERLKLQALLQEIQLGQSGIVDPSTAPRIGRLLGAENVVVGTIDKGSIRLATTLVSSSSEQIQGSASFSVPEEAFFEIPKLIVQKLTEILGLHLTPEEIKALSTPHTKKFKAVVYYGEALDALDAGDWKKAKDLFLMALKIDPYFYLARDGADSTPDPSTPTPSKINTKNLAPKIEDAIKKAEKEQQKIDAEAAAISSGDGGG
ncbi:tetratricopeptide repeat protein [Desulfovulcanus sp.]